MPQDQAIPADIEEIIAALNGATRHAEDLMASAQCLAHLALTNFAYTAAMRPSCMSAIYPRRGTLRVGFPTRWFLCSRHVSSAKVPARRPVGELEGPFPERERQRG